MQAFGEQWSVAFFLPDKPLHKVAFLFQQKKIGGDFPVIRKASWVLTLMLF